MFCYTSSVRNPRKLPNVRSIRLLPKETTGNHGIKRGECYGNDVQEKRLSGKLDNGMQPIVDSIVKINDLHNHEQVLYINSDGVYISDPSISELDTISQEEA